jgi:uncharacterized protein YigE (DUF2233 family)
MVGLVLLLTACQTPPRDGSAGPDAPQRLAIPTPAPLKATHPLRYRQVSRKEIAPGVEWAQYKGQEKGHPVFVNVVSVDPRDERYRLVVAPAEGPGPTRRESTRQIARRHQAIAAINGSYFHFNNQHDGRPIGLVKVAGEVVSEPRGDRPALGVAPDGTAFFGVPRRLTPDEQKAQLAKALLPSPEPMPRWRQWLRDLSGAPKPAKAAPEPVKAPTLNTPWDEAPFALEGGPLLVQAGELNLSKGFDGYIMKAREPRTAVGLTPEGRILLVTVDGRVPGHSKGIALAELAQLFLELGASEALNWDGGGSTTMMVKNELVSRVATGWCRPVSNALLIVENPPEAEADSEVR